MYVAETLELAEESRADAGERVGSGAEGASLPLANHEKTPTPSVASSVLLAFA